MPAERLVLGVLAASSAPRAGDPPLPACVLLSEIGASAAGVRPRSPRALWKRLPSNSGSFSPFSPAGQGCCLLWCRS